MDIEFILNIIILGFIGFVLIGARITSGIRNRNVTAQRGLNERPLTFYSEDTQKKIINQVMRCHLNTAKVKR